jgi:hypothetical protein
MRLRIVLGQVELAIEWLGRIEGEDVVDIRALLGQARTKLLGAIDTCGAPRETLTEMGD